MTVTKQKQTNGYRGQPSDYRQGDGQGRDKMQEGDQEVQTTRYKISVIQVYNAQHKEYSQQFIIILNGV